MTIENIPIFILIAGGLLSITAIIIGRMVSSRKQIGKKIDEMKTVKAVDRLKYSKEQIEKFKRGGPS